MSETPISTHRVIQLAKALDSVEELPSLYRRCASKLAGIGNRLGAIEYTRRAQKADRLLIHLRERLQRDEGVFLAKRTDRAGR